MMYLNETDKVNNLTKLARHRIAARAIALYPDLIDLAYEVTDRLEEQWGPSASNDEWRELLRGDPQELRRVLTARNEHMDQLRIDSPFLLLSQHGLDFTDEEQRRRIWKLAKRVATISSRDEGWNRCSQQDEYRSALPKT